LRHGRSRVAALNEHQAFPMICRRVWRPSCGGWEVRLVVFKLIFADKSYLVWYVNTVYCIEYSFTVLNHNLPLIISGWDQNHKGEIKMDQKLISHGCQPILIPIDQVVATLLQQVIPYIEFPAYSLISWLVAHRGNFAFGCGFKIMFQANIPNPVRLLSSGCIRFASYSESMYIGFMLVFTGLMICFRILGADTGSVVMLITNG
jgi:hypothetical protein